MSACTSFGSFFGVLVLTASSVSADVLGEARQVPIALDTSSVHVADLNRDGRDDLVTTIPDRRLIGILIARPDATFTNMPALDGFGSVATGDFDGDGKTDLVNVDHGTPGGTTVAVFRGRGDGTFHQARYTSLAEAWIFSTLADLNADGLPDIVLSGDFRILLPVAAMLGLPDGSFSAPVVSAYDAIGDVVDVTGDGFPDLIGQVRINNSTPTALLPGNGDGSFGLPRELTESESLLSRAGSDFNGDGLVDVVDIQNIGDPEDYDSRGVLGVHFGSGEGAFLPPIESFVESVWYDLFRSDLDFNGDGRDDLIYVTLAGHSEPVPSYVHLVFGTESGTPDAIETYFDGPPSGLLFGDFNGDGFVDLVIESQGYNYDTYVANLRLNTTFAFRGATFLQKPGGRLRVALDGANFSPEARVFIGDSEKPWPQIRYKSTQRLVLKGGDSLERVFPRGSAVDVRVENPDGRTATVRVTR